MTKKTIQAGSEVEAYCTKCKLDLNHLVVAVEGEKIARCECLTCHTQHNFYKPKSAKAAPKPRKARASAAAAKEPRPKSATALRKAWEQAIAGRTTTDFAPYRMTGTYGLSQLVTHAKYGDGVVTELHQGSKLTVLFGDGEKLLVHGRA